VGRVRASPFSRILLWLPALLTCAGIRLKSILLWEDELEIRVPDGGPCAVFGAAPLHKPLRTIAGALGNNALIPPKSKLEFVRFVMVGLRDYFRRPEGLDEYSVLSMRVCTG
jgi:15-cis-phytoene desaturase